MVSMLWWWYLSKHFVHLSKLSLVSENKQTGNSYFNYFTLLKLIIIFESLFSSPLPPISQSQSIPKSCQVFCSSNRKCLRFYFHPQPSSGTSSMIIFCEINTLCTLFLFCQSPVSIILWTVKMVQIGTLIRKPDTRSFSLQGQA